MGGSSPILIWIPTGEPPLPILQNLNDIVLQDFLLDRMDLLACAHAHRQVLRVCWNKLISSPCRRWRSGAPLQLLLQIRSVQIFPQSSQVEFNIDFFCPASVQYVDLVILVKCPCIATAEYICTNQTNRSETLNPVCPSAAITLPYVPRTSLLLHRGMVKLACSLSPSQTSSNKKNLYLANK
jgi:hypothetical protein